MANAPKSLQKLAKSYFSADLKMYLAETILELDTLHGVDFADKEKAAIECLGRKLAAQKLHEILSTLLTDTEGGTIKDEKDDFSLTVK
jgi:hypothetical protein